MNILRPLIAGIATGIGMRFGSDIYDKLKTEAAASKGSLKGFNPFRGSDDGPDTAQAADAKA